MKAEAKWKHIEELVKAQARLMEDSLKKNPSLREQMSSPIFIRFNIRNWCQLTPGKSVVIGISGKFMQVCRWKTQ